MTWTKNFSGKKPSRPFDFTLLASPPNATMLRLTQSKAKKASRVPTLSAHLVALWEAKRAEAAAEADENNGRYLCS